MDSSPYGILHNETTVTDGHGLGGRCMSLPGVDSFAMIRAAWFSRHNALPGGCAATIVMRNRPAPYRCRRSGHARGWKVMLRRKNPVANAAAAPKAGP